MSDWDGWGPGMSGPPIAAAKGELRRRFSYGKDLDDSEDWTPELTTALIEYQRRVHAEVLAGKRQPPDVRADGRIDWATQVQLGLIDRAPAGPPPPPANRHLAVVYRGTGGIIGQDYVSRVCQANYMLVEEVNPQWAATMGGIPVGAAGGLGDLSMRNAVEVAVADGQRIILDALRANPHRMVVIGGYSAGAVCAARLRQWMHANYPDNYLCSFSLGDPTRPAGGAYYLGAPAPGQGISSWRYGDIGDFRHCWLAAPGDMYTSIPLGLTGDIMDDIYDTVTAVQLSDPLATAHAILSQIPETAPKIIGQPLPSVFAQLAAGPAGWLGLGLPLLIGSLTGLITGAMGGPDYTGELPGPAAAAQAALIALRFVADNPPTRAHITYEWQEVWPGQSYLGLAIQHVRDHASRTTAVAA